MTKQEAIALFGTKKNPGTPKMLAQALGISTQAISQWPQVLTRRLRNQVLGAKYDQKMRKKKDDSVSE